MSLLSDSVRLTDFCGEKLYGRDDDIRLLRSILPPPPQKRNNKNQQHSSNDEDAEQQENGPDAISQEEEEQNPTSRIVLVRGASGTGKSSLVYAAYGNHSRCLFGSGKFLNNHKSSQSSGGGEQHVKPYAALESAVTEISETILQSPQDKQKYRSILTKKMQHAERQLLSFHMPEIAELLGVVDDDSSVSSSSDHGDKKDTTTCAADKNDETGSVSSTVVSDGGGISKSKSFRYGYEKLVYITRHFFCALSSIPERPLVLFLDDVQWIDSTTLQLLQDIVTPKNVTERPRHLIFVASYRNDEVDDSHIFMQWITGIEQREEQQRRQEEEESTAATAVAVSQEAEELAVRTGTVPPPDESPGSTSVVTTCMSPPPFLLKVDIGNLNPQALMALLCDLLKVVDENEPHVKELVDVVHDRTLGNIFHVLQLLDHLQAEGLIEYSLMQYRWTWNMTKIRNSTNLCDNVLTIVLSKIRRLDETHQSCLELCSRLGFRFDLDALVIAAEAVWKTTSSTSDGEVATTSRLDKSLNKLVKEKLLEEIERGRYKFAHDKVYEMALQLSPDSEKCALVHLEIGKALWEAHGFEDHSVLESANDRQLFLCADQLNRGLSIIAAHCDMDARTIIVRLNIRAAHRAAAFSAFFPSVKYLEAAIALLPKSETEQWTNHYEICLELYTSLAEMLLATGQVEQQTIAVAKALAHAKSIDDSFRAYMVKVRYYKTRGLHSELISTCLHILKELGEPLPPKPSKCYAKRCTSRLQKRAGGLSDDHFLSLPIMTDEHKAAAVRVICEMCGTATNILNRKNFVAVMLSRTIEITLDYGLTPLSGVAFTLAGLHLTSQYDVDGGCRLAKLGKKLAIAVTNDSGVPSYQVMTFANLSLHWRVPLSLLVDSQFEGYESSMRSGDRISAFWCITAYSSMYFYSGLPIEPLADDLKNFCQLAVDYGQRETVLMMATNYQCISNLLGRSDNILSLSQGALKKYRSEFDWNGSMGQEMEWSYAMQIAFYCEAIDRASAMAEKLKKVDQGFGKGMFFDQVRVFFFALIAIAQCRAATVKKHLLKQEAWRHEAKRFYGMVRFFVQDKKSINVAQKLLILDAEMMTLEHHHHHRRVDAGPLRAAYDKAIAASARAGFLQDAALAAHLASISVPDQQDSLSYFQRAQEFYLTWGARGVVDHLIAKRQGGSSSSWSTYEGDSVQSSNSSSGTGHRSRRRYDPSFGIDRKSLHIPDQQQSSGGAVPSP